MTKNTHTLADDGGAISFPASHGARTSSSQKFSTPKSKLTYERILEAAVDCFVEIGYHRTNMSKIAQRAGVTRSRVQYYFESTEHLLTDAARHLLLRLWGRYQEQLASPGNERDRMDFAFDQFIRFQQDRYYIAWMELVAASRTEPVLRSIVEPAQAELDRQAADATARLFAAAKNDPTRFETARDITRMFVEGLTTGVLPNDEARRRANMISLLRHLMQHVWSANPQDLPNLEPQIKP